MIDMQRRKRVMQRSIKLGHCICNPKQPCPCDPFKEKNICACAGERLDNPSGEVRLTQLVEKPGCASKIDQAFLKEVLQGLPSIEDPRVLVGVPAGDDAGVYDLGDGQALVQTVDVFTPSVDEPYLFGQVAAANSVSDIYAMGGTPMTALSVIGFPMRKIPDSAMKDILRGGIDKMNEAGVAIIGGHSINDDQIKAGFAVTGWIDKNRIVTNAGARPGDVLILTKPLGTGIVAFAGQIDRAAAEHLRAAAQSMTELNRTASEMMLRFGAHACTDVTGFSLMGHLAEMARASGVDVELVWDDIPLLPGVLEYAAAGILPGATERNKASCGRQVDADASLPVEMVDLCYDAQTSGGLLITASKENGNELVKALHDAGIVHATMVGVVAGKGPGRVSLQSTGHRSIPRIESTNKPTVIGGDSQVACGADTAGSPANLDAYTKQAIAVALSVALRCESCLKMHLASARKKGFTLEEIDEAAAIGISFAGAPAKAFYEQLTKQAK
jgi:selenide,water dikinase